MQISDFVGCLSRRRKQRIATNEQEPQMPTKSASGPKNRCPNGLRNARKINALEVLAGFGNDLSGRHREQQVAWSLEAVLILPIW
jgi:hypothetical protein